MSKASERTTQTIARLREEKPVLKGLIDAFEPIWLAQRQEVDRLQEQFALHSMDLSARDPQRFSQGVSLLTGGDLAPLWPFARECSASLLQHFASNSQLLPKFDAVTAFLEKEQDKAFSNDFLRALLDMDDERMATLVEGSDEERASITFVCEFLLSTVLKAFTANIAAGEKDPWTLWTQGHCPVCGRAYADDEILGFDSSLASPCCHTCDTMNSGLILPPNARRYIRDSLSCQLPQALGFILSENMQRRLLRYVIRLYDSACSVMLKSAAALLELDSLD